ncbi:hypothetical protein [Myxococcus sp. AM010]|uniref:hypothetical protein n=1 Tax=Myxococcus sp. AM010 TaxID=2745138 RepID=UPI00159609B7|nr:hypothetical protein [Myxococcus sp. AM010]NVJ16829.1 hypothetical protein [Myxococcus sp. AM010]
MSPRIDQRALSKLGAKLQKDAGPAQARTPTATASAVRYQTQRNADVFQGAAPLGLARGVLGDTVAALNTSPVEAPALTPEQQASAEEAQVEATNHQDPSYLTDWLKAHPDPAQQAAFMDRFFEVYGTEAGQLLDLASEEDLPVLSDALDAAYRSGAVTLDELTAAVGSHLAGSVNGETHETLAKIIAGTGNPELITAYAQRELEVMMDSNAPDPVRSVAIATALAGLPPDQLQAFLKDNPDALGHVFKNLNDPDVAGSEALGRLLDAASAIQPATPESIKLFMDSIGHLEDNPESRAAAARFFMRHADAILAAASDASGSIGSEGAGRLSEFFTRTLFTEPSFEGQEELHAFITSKLGDMQTQLEAEARTNPPSQDAQRLARSMGSLVGAIEGGFLLSVEELNKRNEAVEGMTGLLFKLKDLLPSSSIPGLGTLQDLTIDQIQDWVTEALKENPDDPQDAIPFHQLFGESIFNPVLRGLYDSARLTSLENRELGLNP